jgi:hypothetical protein
MKHAAKHLLIVCGLSLWVAFGFALTAEAQNREKYIISAKAGGINFVTGNVMMRHKGESSQRALTSSDNLLTGDSVTTGAGGRVEILLNPGSYMRLDENSEVELTDASLDNLLVTLVKGRALVEVTGGDSMQLMIGVNTPQTQALITRGGIYRFSILPNQTTEIVVRKGRLILDKGTPNEIKSGRKVIIGRAVAEVAKSDKKDQDTLDLWSKDRAETLARANRRLERRILLSAFSDYTWSDMSAWGQRSPRFGSLGLWVYNPSNRSHCFLPIGPTAWSSPYGHRYGNGFNPYGIPNDWPQNVGSGNWPPNIIGNPRTSGGGAGTNGGAGNGNGGGGTAPAPQPQPQPMQPTPAPVRDFPVERRTREYTIQSPNR